ncbi:MAG: MgtC/SapB family protein [Calditrichaceae bacterium]
MSIDSGWIEIAYMLIKLAIAGLCGAIIGLEYKSNPTTYVIVLISVGSAVFTMVPLSNGFGVMTGPQSGLISPVVVSIGLITAGVIVKNHDIRAGLKMGAAMWISGAVGLAVGAGAYIPAVIVTLIGYVLIGKMEPVEDKDSDSDRF